MIRTRFVMEEPGSHNGTSCDYVTCISTAQIYRGKWHLGTRVSDVRTNYIDYLVHSTNVCKNVEQ